MESNVDLSQLALELIAPRSWIFLLQFRFYTRFLCAQSLIECVSGRSSALHRALLFPVGFRAGARPVSLSPIDADMEGRRCVYHTLQRAGVCPLVYATGVLSLDIRYRKWARLNKFRLWNVQCRCFLPVGPGGTLPKAPASHTPELGPPLF